MDQPFQFQNPVEISDPESSSRTRSTGAALFGLVHIAMKPIKTIMAFIVDYQTPNIVTLQSESQ